MEANTTLDKEIGSSEADKLFIYFLKPNFINQHTQTEMKDGNSIAVNGLARKWLLCLCFNLRMWGPSVTLKIHATGFSNYFPEQEHKAEQATIYTCSHNKNDRKLNVVSVIGHEYPRSCPACEDITCRNILMNDSLWFSGSFIYIYIYMSVCVCMYLHMYICILLLFQKRSSWFLRRPSIKTLL